MRAMPQGFRKDQGLVSGLLDGPERLRADVVSMDPFVADDRGVKHLALRTFLRDGWG